MSSINITKTRVVYKCHEYLKRPLLMSQKNVTMNMSKQSFHEWLLWVSPKREFYVIIIQIRQVFYTCHELNRSSRCHELIKSLKCHELKEPSQSRELNESWHTHTEWRRPIGCLKLQVIFRKRATHDRALSQKMACKDKASYGSTPPCSWESTNYGSLLQKSPIKETIFCKLWHKSCRKETHHGGGNCDVTHSWSWHMGWLRLVGSLQL